MNPAYLPKISTFSITKSGEKGVFLVQCEGMFEACDLFRKFVGHASWNSVSSSSYNEGKMTLKWESGDVTYSVNRLN